MRELAVVIPAYNPLPSLVPFVMSLANSDFEVIVVVNDGSDKKYEQIFEEICNIDRCVVLQQERNEGKGKALKVGFNYILKNYKKLRGIITAGAHDQHKLNEVEVIAHTSQLFSDGIILGVREFRSKEIPLINFFANRAASMLFETFFRKRLLDIQSGLRYIPKQQLFWLKNVPGKGFNYDTNMLVEAIQRNIPIYEVPIGQARVKKNSVIFYDEILHPTLMLQQVWVSFLKNKFK